MDQLPVRGARLRPFPRRRHGLPAPGCPPTKYTNHTPLGRRPVPGAVHLVEVRTGDPRLPLGHTRPQANRRHCTGPTTASTAPGRDGQHTDHSRSQRCAALSAKNWAAAVYECVARQVPEPGAASLREPAFTAVARVITSGDRHRCLSRTSVTGGSKPLRSHPPRPRPPTPSPDHGRRCAPVPVRPAAGRGRRSSPVESRTFVGGDNIGSCDAVGCPMAPKASAGAGEGGGGADFTDRPAHRERGG